MGLKKYKFFSCRDIGLDCGFMVRADKEKEIVQVVLDHSCRRHHTCYVTPEVEAKIQSNIKNLSI